MKHNDKMEILKWWEDTTKNQEFTYPMWFKSKETGDVVEFSSLMEGIYIYINPKYSHYYKPLVGEKATNFIISRLLNR